MKKLFYMLLLLSLGCMDEFEKRDILIKNNSDKVIYPLISKNESLRDPYITYNDTLIENFFGINTFSKGKIKDKPRNWDSYIAQSSEQKLHLFIISSDSVRKYGWREVLNKRTYTKYYKLNIKDLDSLKWQINFEEP